MALNIYFKKESMLDFFLMIVFLGVFFGGGIYLISTVLVPFRVGLVVLFFLLVYFYRRETLSLNLLSILVLILFSYQFLVNGIVVVSQSEIDFSKFINSFLLYFFIIGLVLLSSHNQLKYNKILFKSINIFLVILILTTFIEFKYHIHFSFSNALLMGDFYSFIPTGYYTNQNDMMAIYTLILLFNLVYIDFFSINNSFYNIYYISTFLYGLFLSVITSSRIALLALIVIFFIFLVRKTKKVFLLISIFILLFLFFIYSDILIAYYEANAIGSGNSTDMRINLYKDALENLTIFGYGFDNSDIFYLKLDDLSVLGMINPHNYLLELLINNGYVFFLLYIIFNIYLVISSFMYKEYLLSFALMLYQFILLSSSSSLFLWQHYIFYIAFITLFQIRRENAKNDISPSSTS